MPLPGSTRHCLTSTMVPIMTEAPPAPPLPRTQRPSSFPPEVLRPHYTHIAPTLTLWPLAVLIFYNIFGFPSGIELSIHATGNFYHILGFLLFPLVLTLPKAAVMAEMGAAFQDHSAGGWKSASGRPGVRGVGISFGSASRQTTPLNHLVLGVRHRHCWEDGSLSPEDFFVEFGDVKKVCQQSALRVRHCDPFLSLSGGRAIDTKM
mmetsp:Transcript_11555/g.24368  ORF Transcript_11555/g.24368 Transcript_11555/m.24368 type:complete len:206 (+) Transcript_11555:187-804(+)